MQDGNVKLENYEHPILSQAHNSKRRLREFVLGEGM